MRIKRQSGNWGYGSPLPNVRRSTLPRIHINNREAVNNEVLKFCEVLGTQYLIAASGFGTDNHEHTNTRPTS